MGHFAYRRPFIGMTALTTPDVDELILTFLDFEPTPNCEAVGEPEHTATVYAVMSCCGRRVPLCAPHAHEFKHDIELLAAISPLVGQSFTCLECGAEFPQIDDIVPITGGAA